MKYLEDWDMPYGPGQEPNEHTEASLLIWKIFKITSRNEITGCISPGQNCLVNKFEDLNIMVMQSDYEIDIRTWKLTLREIKLH